MSDRLIECLVEIEWEIKSHVDAIVNVPSLIVSGKEVNLASKKNQDKPSTKLIKAVRVGESTQSVLSASSED